MSKQNSAFTLVELAIVIVIIGLLVGGVLQGQELIAQAKLRRTIAELDSLDASILTFQAKYNALPGDMRNATNIWGEVSANCTTQLGTGTQTCNGNGDKIISYENSVPSNHEGIRVWQHLSNAKLIKGSFTGHPAAGSKKYEKGVSIPANQYNGGWTIWNASIPAIVGWAGRSGHFYSFAHTEGQSPTGLSAATWYKYSLTAEQLMQIDLKIDDGKPWRGLVRNMGSNYTSNCATEPETTNSNADYDLTRNSLECIPMLPSKVM